MLCILSGLHILNEQHHILKIAVGPLFHGNDIAIRHDLPHRVFVGIKTHRMLTGVDLIPRIERILAESRVVFLEWPASKDTEGGAPGIKLRGTQRHRQQCLRVARGDGDYSSRKAHSGD